MKPSRFRYHSPSALEEVLDVLAEFGSAARLLAGGQSLIPMLNFRLSTPEHLIDLNRVHELEVMEAPNGEIRVGALVRQRAVERSAAVAERCPLVIRALAHVGHPIIRNRGTIAGSIAHADPAAELPAVLAVLGGTVHLASKGGQREIHSKDFFRGPFETELRPDEIVTEVRFPVPSPGTGASFLEIARRHGDFAICAVAAIVGRTGGRVSFAGVGPIPHTVDVTDALTEGIDSAAELAVADLRPSGDIHGSTEYRKHLARVLVRRALVEASAERDGSA